MPSNNGFQYSKIRTRKRGAKKSIKTGKKNGIQLFLESGIHFAGIRNPESTEWNPESKTVLDSLTWGEAAHKQGSLADRDVDLSYGAREVWF